MAAFSLPPFPPVEESVPILGVPAEALITENDQAATVTFVSEVAANNNALGFFALDEAGNFADGEIVVSSTKNQNPGDSIFIDIFPDGTQLGFFLIPNGGDIIAGLPGEFLGSDVQFLSDGEVANAFDLTPPEVVLSSVVKGVDGNISVVETAVDSPVFFTFDPTAGNPLTNELNDGGFTQVIAGVSPESDKAVRIGFEDLVLNEGDTDFNDLIFDVTLTNIPADADLLFI
jgi:hypothetical protein